MPRLRRRKKRWDPQPTEQCTVLLASDGRHGFSKRAVAQAAALAGSGPVAVLTLARVHGTSLGIPHPGLMPTKAELKERYGWVDDAISTLKRRGLDADGQVASTRRMSRTIVRVAELRGAQAVVVDIEQMRRARRAIEGDIGREVARKLGRHGVRVEVIASGETRSARP